MALSDNILLDQWLQSGIKEEVIEPELPIVDPHHHLWDIRQYTESPHSRFLQKIYLCEEFSKDIHEGGHNIIQTVFAECNAFFREDGPESMKCIGETEVIHGIASMSRSGLYGKPRLCTGIFGTADLSLGKAVESVILGHMEASPNFRGIRSPFPKNLNAQFLEGYRLLGKYNLSYDNYSPDFERLPILAKLAREVPEVPIIVNHLGGKIFPDDEQRWRECVKVIAECPNTFMKTGGAQQRVDLWEPPFHIQNRETPIGSEELCELLYPYYLFAIETFGPDRCMFESNFPVDKECLSYRTLWNMFKRIVAKAGLSESEKTQMFSGTAIRVYNLPSLN